MPDANLDVLRRLDLPRGDYAIFGSGPLMVRGIIDSVNDLDIICRGEAWELAKRAGELKYLPAYDVHIVEMAGGQITFGTEWGIGDFDIDELIDSADEIAGLPFVRLEYVADYKRIARRPKDAEHLRALRKWNDAQSAD